MQYNLYRYEILDNVSFSFFCMKLKWFIRNYLKILRFFNLFFVIMNGRLVSCIHFKLQRTNKWQWIITIWKSHYRESSSIYASILYWARLNWINILQLVIDIDIRELLDWWSMLYFIYDNILVHVYHHIWNVLH